MGPENFKQQNIPEQKLQLERRIVQEANYPKLWDMESLEKVASHWERIEQERLHTPLRNLDLRKDGYGQVLVKDESVNPTGTHKDRLGYAMAEQFVFESKTLYQHYLNNPSVYEHDKNLPSRNSIQRFSLITSGHGGMALATAFKKYELPPPKLLLDQNTPADVIQTLTQTGADVYTADFSKKSLSREDILALTNNEFGVDLTSENLGDFGYWRTFYPYLAREVFREQPQHIYVPYGSGNLYEGLLSIQPSLPKNLWQTNIYGGEPADPNTKAIMLAAPSKPFKYFDPVEMQRLHEEKKTGKFTGVYKVFEVAIEDAHSLYQKHGIKAGYSSADALALYMTQYATNKEAAAGKTIIINTGRGIVKEDW